VQPKGNGSKHSDNDYYSKANDPNLAVIGAVERNILPVAPDHCSDKNQRKEYGKNGLSPGKHFSYIYADKGKII
jgi:hypothetical protein